jgi:O-methyltransferase involved in polyketide biosynthesis
LPNGPLSWSLAVRTKVFDELILDAVHGGVRVVLNLAAGLDARRSRSSWLLSGLIFALGEYG